MNIFISHPSSSSFLKELYEPLKNCPLIQEHSFYFPYDLGYEKATRAVVEQQDLLVAEVSLPSTGQGIELGWATAKGIPVACFYKKGSTPSGALPYITQDIFAYTDTADFVTQLTHYLTHLSH